MVAQVLVAIKTTHIDKTFSYLVSRDMEDSIQVGCRVLVPFGKQKLEGFVLSLSDEVESEYPLKSILELRDIEPVLSEELLELGKWMGQKTLCNLITAYQTMLPSFMKASTKKRVGSKYVTYLRLIHTDAVTSEKQRKIIELFKNNTEVLKSSATEISLSAVKTLLAHGNIEEIQKEVSRVTTIEKSDTKKDLSKEQEVAVHEITTSLTNFKPFLLHGVTGSGKTEVYLQVIEQVLNEGKEALVLVPEISLTPQFISVFSKRFGSMVATLHSRLSDGEKYDEWNRVIRGEAKIVIGARSAIFAPLKNLGIIVVDEEHSTTYKQENHPRYHAIDVALKRARYCNIPIVLGSATPSLESYTRAKSGIYKLLEMKERISTHLPKVELVDMKKEIRHGARVLSRILKLKMEERIQNGEQILLLLNRRGYSTSILCKNCGFTHKCPNCDIPLIYHKKKNAMICHYCGYKVPKLLTCPVCHEKGLTDMGMGTEKLEQYVIDNVVGAKVLRMDNDTTTKKGSHSFIIDSFEKQKYNVLIGTQMIAKGLDFPNVTLVGVISADASLMLPDYRSSERTFELLCQVAGRSGRGTKEGEVIIQGFNVDHYSIVDASHHDYYNFYLHEMALRKKLKYTPYFNVSVVKIRGKLYDLVMQEAEKIATHLRSQLTEVIILGPTAAALPKLNNLYYAQVILKYKKSEKVFEQFRFIQEMYRKNAKIQIDIDASPIHL